MRSIYQNTGYLRNDDRASGGVLTEQDILTCLHCQKVLKRERNQYLDADWCSRCAAPICRKCAAKALTEGCVPFKKLVDEAMERTERAKQNARVMGIGG